MNLTAQQVDHFQTFGFLVLRGLLRPDEVSVIENEVLDAMATAYADTPFDGTQRHWLPLLSPQAPALSSLIEDDRFLGVAEQLLGPGAIPMLADANRYVGDTHWHRDGLADGVKFAIYLDRVDEATGALRVIPGSHRPEFHQVVDAYREAHDPAVADMPSVVCASDPGDAVAFNFPLIHASTGGSEDRRMCTVNYYKAPAAEAEAEQIRGHLHGIVRMTEHLWTRGGFPFYDPAWAEEAQAGPTRRELVRRMTEARMFETAEAAAASMKS